MASGIRIISAGLLTTIQDFGRSGLQHSGIAPAGALDKKALSVANILVGNPRETAGIEMTLAGATFEFTETNIATLTGGDFRATLDGTPLAPYTAFIVRKGQRLSTGNSARGCRAYLSVAGGFDIPETMGSRSTNLKCGIGGLNGKPLCEGDEIAFARPVDTLARMSLRRASIPDFGWPCTVLRVLAGPQADHFTKAGIATFYSASYTVTNRSDRMASVLEGQTVEAEGKTDIISDGVPLGGIQIPSDGKPIVMLADRQTTGGYAKIATIISADIPAFAQRRPGERIVFREVSSDEAVEARRTMLNEIAELERRIKNYG